MNMKKGVKKKCGVYNYLHSIKVLEIGSNQDIINARKAYWKEYKAKWRKEKRIAEKEFTLTLASEEAKILRESARAHRQSISRFIRNAALAYLRRQYIVPDPLAIGTIRQLLAMNYNALHRLFEENRLPFDIGRMLLTQMADLEQKVITELYNPKERKETAM